jgi:hypothetical protein
MNVSRILTFAGVMTLVAVGTSSPAEAVGPPADGMYTFTEAGLPAAVTWKITALCDAPSRQRAIPDFTDPVIAADLCGLNVSSTTARAISHSEKMVNYVGRARLANDLWTFDVPREDGVACPGGGTAASTETYAFDDVSLTGTHTSIHGDVCGLQPGMTKTPFSLAFKGPIAIPVERYPLDCNEIGQCR